jgi:phage terminase small subunit
MAFSPLQQRFCEEYVVDLNATQAAIRAGYKATNARSQASALLTKPNIQEEIQRLREERSKRVGLTADVVLNRLRQLVTADIR